MSVCPPRSALPSRTCGHRCGTLYVSAGFVIALLLLLTIGTVALLNSQAGGALTAERTRHRNLLLEMKDLLSTMQDAETGQRGFLLTADDRYLEPYLGARQTIDNHLARIARLDNDPSDTSAYLGEARRLIQAKLAELDGLIAARRSAGIQAALAIVASGDDQRIMDDFRLLHQREEKRITRALDEVVIDDALTARNAFILMALGILAALALLTGSFILLRRESDLRQRTAKMLAHRHGELTAVLTAASEASIIATDTNGLITVFNRGAERMLGHRADDLVGRMTPAILHVESEVADHARRLTAELGRPISGFETFVARARSGGHDEREWTYVRQDGSQLSVTLAVTAVRDDHGTLTGFLGVALDVTARKQAADLLRRASEQAQAADRLKSAFLASMSHELRTPLNAIIGFTGILLQGLAGPLNAEQAKQLGMVRSSSRHLLALINDVLDLSKIEAGQLEISLQPFDLRKLISEVIGIVTPQAKAKDLTLRVDQAAGTDHLVSDRRRVGQVLLNLLTNAIKFTTHDGEVALTVDRLLVEHAPDQVRLAVSDTGIGIAADELPTLFQPFRQLDSGLARNHEGTGLGLAISRRLVDLMGGGITATSRPGQGSTFTVTLPLMQPEPSPAAVPV